VKVPIFRISALALLALLVAPLSALASSRPVATGLDGVQVPNFNPPAAQLRVALDTTLAEHAFLLSQAMRTGLSGGADFEAAGATLEENTVDLVNMIASVYGSAAGEAFGQQWRSHIAYLIDYTRALADNDDAARNLADQQLQQYVADFSKLLASANPNLPEDAVAGLISEHVEQLKQVATFDAGDYSKAYPALHETFEHMFEIGDALSGGIALQFPGKFTGKSLAFSPAGNLRLALDRLLGEHTTLAITAMQAGVTNAEDEGAARTALDANTDALAAAIGDIYGADAGDAFLDLWTTHTDAYLDYVAATTAGNTAGQQDALARLATYRNNFSEFLADANPNLSASALREMLRHHTSQLVQEVDAFAAGDFAQAYALSREAFSHAVDVGDALAEAIAAQFPDKFPDARMAYRRSEPIVWMGILLLMVALVAAQRHLVVAAVKPHLTT
jgi:hypothetical protein